MSEYESQQQNNLELEMDEIEGYASCETACQDCQNDCAWPFSGPMISGVD